VTQSVWRLGRDNRGIGIRLSARARDYSFLNNVLSNVGPTQPATQWAVSPSVTGLGSEADPSPPSSSEVENVGDMLPLPHASSWCDA
jgi:hypothetical protein